MKIWFWILFIGCLLFFASVEQCNATQVAMVQSAYYRDSVLRYIYKLKNGELIESDQYMRIGDVVCYNKKERHAQRERSNSASLR